MQLLDLGGEIDPHCLLGYVPTCNHKQCIISSKQTAQFNYLKL